MCRRSITGGNVAALTKCAPHSRRVVGFEVVPGGIIGHEVGTAGKHDSFVYRNGKNVMKVLTLSVLSVAAADIKLKTRSLPGIARAWIRGAYLPLRDRLPLANVA